jgi:hypothetical protein
MAGLDAELDQALDAILAGGAEAIRAQKRLNHDYEELPLAQSVAASIDEFEAAYATGEPARLIGDYLRRRRNQAQSRK